MVRFGDIKCQNIIEYAETQGWTRHASELSIYINRSTIDKLPNMEWKLKVKYWGQNLDLNTVEIFTFNFQEVF